MVNCDATRLPALSCIDCMPCPQLRCHTSLRTPPSRNRKPTWTETCGPNLFAPQPLRQRCRVSLRGKGRRRRVAVWASGDDRYEFDESQYRRLSLQLIVQNNNESFSGTLILIEEPGEITSNDEAKCLLLQVGGDTLLGISHVAQNSEPQRPMTLDLLLKIIDHAKELSERNWQLLHVAIVELRENTFVGRLFFGDPETNEILWDCDCRPSDGCWLALKKLCPLYIRNTVWEQSAQPLKLLFSVEQTRSLLENMPQFSQFAGESEEDGDPLTSVRESDPVVIKRLKRQMSVAISEEDYTTAAKIRDHPYMTKYRLIYEHKKAGRLDEASDLLRALEKEIEDNDNVL